MAVDFDSRLVSTTLGHLGILAANSLHDASEPVLRASSGSLRALLVERMLLQAWRVVDLGGSITIPTWRFSGKPRADTFGYCGGADILPGIPISAGFNTPIEKTVLNLHDFCKQPRIMIGPATVSTVEVVQYIANSMGGAHWDPGSRRKPVIDTLRELESSDESPLPMLVNGRNLLHHELLSISQALLRSPEVVTLRSV